MNACGACEPTHNDDVRTFGRCWCPCHGARRVPTAEQWEHDPRIDRSDPAQADAEDRWNAANRKEPPMTDLDHTFISHRRLLVQAGDLLSDHGDDPVHDEAIVELVARLLGNDDHAAVSTLIIQTYSRS